MDPFKTTSPSVFIMKIHMEHLRILRLDKQGLGALITSVRSMIGKQC